MIKLLSEENIAFYVDFVDKYIQCCDSKDY